ncbi:MAG TPA: YgcG family protein [Steroidobacteraceae bacterium]|nr:YgcG family protein [Steroidobacteraceae bacterium]
MAALSIHDGPRLARGMLLCAWFWLATAFTPALGQALVAVPPLESPVTDLTGTLTPDQVSALDAKLRAFAKAKGSQVAVLIVPTTRPEEIEQFSIRVVDQWRLGRGRIDDGVLLLVALNDRRMRIEVGYGLEGALPDATANRIIQQDITPAFKRGDYYGGIMVGVDRIMRVIEGEPLPEPEISPPAAEVPGLFSVLPLVFVFVLVGGSILRRLFGRVGGALATGGLVGFLTWMIVAVLGLSIAAGVVAFVFALLGGMGGGGGRGWYSGRHGRGWGYPGGIGGGWGGGGGGFGGGWSGGGGGFGGGGASGGW